MCLNDSKKNYEQMLLDKLLKNYNNKLRPSGQYKTVQVKLALNLMQIIDIIEKDQIIVINAFVDHKWTDPRLSWNPKEFGNLTLTRISGDRIWTPDTFIYTTADQNGFLIPQSGAYFVVKNDGEIFWPSPQTQLRVRCRMGILWFPFDEQLCVIVFGSWSHSMSYLNYSLISEEPSLEGYTENNVWTLLKYKPFRNEVKYDAWIENDPFSEVIYKILVRRKPLFVLQNCVIPAVMLCILTLVSFFIPFAPEMQIGISIMLAFSVFKLRLSDDVPVQSDIIPLINVYFTLCMTFSLSAMIWFSIKNLLVENKTVPKFLRYLVLEYIWYLLLLNVLNIFEFKSLNEAKVPTQNSIEEIKPLRKKASIRKQNKYVLPKSSESEKTDDVMNYYDEKPVYEIDHRGKKNLLIRIKHKNKPIENEQTNREFIKILVNNHEITNANRMHYNSLCDLDDQDLFKKLDKSLVRLTKSNIEERTQSNLLPPLIKLQIKERKTSSGSSYFNKNVDDCELGKLSHKISSFNLSNSIIKEINTINEKENITDTNSINHANNKIIFLKDTTKEDKVKLCNKTKIDRSKINDLEVIKILNGFIFVLFLIFIVCLNLFGLFILPTYAKKSLSLDD